MIELNEGRWLVAGVLCCFRDRRRRGKKGGLFDPQGTYFQQSFIQAHSINSPLAPQKSHFLL